MNGRQRSAARGVKAGLTRLRRRRWSSPSMQRMLRRSSSASGPVSMLKSSASLSPGKVVERLRRKTSAASRSSTIAPIGVAASQPWARSSAMRGWKAGPRRAGSA